MYVEYLSRELIVVYCFGKMYGTPMYFLKNAKDSLSLFYKLAKNSSCCHKYCKFSSLKC